MPSAPLPPIELVGRVGVDHASGQEVDHLRLYEQHGRAIRDALDARLPADWSWAGKRVLDFGCGSGRVLRHLLDETERGAQLHGCDIDAPSIAWLGEHLGDRVSALANDENPPLPYDDGAFDVVLATSVFTHLTDTWADWLAELHRVLAPGGFLLATILNRGVWSTGFTGARGIAWDDARIGMHVERYGASFSNSWGPAVFVSEWWVREHWGRGFELVRFEPAGFAQPDPTAWQGCVLLRRTPGAVTAQDLRALGDDPREVTALEFSRDQAYREVGQLIGYSVTLQDQVQRLQAQVEQLQAQRADADRRAAVVEQSRSWRMTRPARMLAAAARARRGA